MESHGVYGAAAGGLAVVLFAAGGALVGERPGFDTPGSDVAAFLADRRGRIQLACALDGLAGALLVWFLATAASLARAEAPAADRSASTAYGCGLVFVALFLADVTALAVGALRPENMAAAPELAEALRDFEWLAMGTAAFAVAGMLAALAAVVLRHGAVWPRWVGLLALAAAAAYALRAGTLFTTDGAFAADGALGLVVPVGALTIWLLAASAVLARRLAAAGAPRGAA